MRAKAGLRPVGFVMTLVLVMLAVLGAGSAQATPGIDTTWGNNTVSEESLGGLFSKRPRGVAVAPGGEVYVSDAENNRIQRFGAGGAFIAAWGKNVDAIGGSTEFEVCVVAANCQAASSGSLGRDLSAPAGIAVAPAGVPGAGDVYVIDTDNRRVQVFGPNGEFRRAFGRDVVQSGKPGDNPAASEVQTLTVDAGAGSFKLTFQGKTTGDLPFSSSAATVQSALEGLESIGTGNVTVSGGSGAPGGGTPYVIVFAGALSESPQPAIAAASGAPPLSGGAASASVVETTPGSTGFEVCEVAADCKAGATGASGGAFGAFGGIGPGAPGSGLTVAPDGAPNEGNVLVADAGNQRVAEFTPTGQFRRAFGWDVVAAGPGNDASAPANQFEVCAAASFDACQAGSAGAGAGQFASDTPTRVVEDKDGRIYAVEPSGNFRVQRFALPADVVTPEGEFAAAALHGTASGDKNNTTEVAVDGAGSVYAVKAFPTGTGTPPCEVEGALPEKWCQRILKLDPLSEAVVETMAVNPGIVNLGQNVRFENVTGLVASGAGAPLYATTANGTLNSYARVWRLNEITGLGASEIRAEEVKASSATLKAAITPAAIAAAFPLGSAYRFEYSSDDGISWKATPLVDAMLGDGSAGGTAANCPTVAAATCHVQQKVTGLVPGTTYRLRVAVYALYNKGTPLRVEGEELNTVASAPVVRTGAAQWSSPPATGPSLRLAGAVNPGNDRGTYLFQYVDEATYLADKGAGGSGFEHATATPEREAGHGLGDVEVGEVIAGLDPALSYRYRLVASNSVGTQTGAERAVAPPSDGDRFFELVSAGDSWGAGIDIKVGSVSDDGRRAMFQAQAFGDPESVPGVYNRYVSVRGSGGWGVAETMPSPGRAFSKLSLASAAADLETLLWLETSVGERERSEAQFVLRGIDGSEEAAGPQLVPLKRQGQSEYTLEGAAGDLSQIVFSFGTLGGGGNVALLAGEPLLTSNVRSNLYVISGAGGPSPALGIVNRADGAAGAILGGACGAEMPTLPHAISDDGAAVYFYAYAGSPAGGACGAPGPRRLYKRLNGTSTVEVSAPQCSPACGGPDGDAEFLGAAADGETVFFKTVRRLLNSDTDSTADLYLYDATPPAGQPTLVQVSAGEAVAVGHPVPGSGAEVLGILDNAADGSRVYFVAKGRLTAAATQGANNLFVYERDGAHPSGRIAFIGGLAPGSGGDQNEWQEGSVGSKQATALPVQGGEGDGHMLAFVSAVKLRPEDTDSSRDLYTYDDGTATTRCLSCAGSGAFDVWVATRPMASNRPDHAQQARMASEDLSTFAFSTQEKLLAGDENLTWDAYAWREGSLSLVSAGSGSAGIAPGAPKAFQQTAVSADGKDVFFITAAALVGSDTNNSLDLYDARVGGGFPEAARAVGCASEAGCQGSAGAAPVPSAPGSDAVRPGNPPVSKPAKPRSCKKGKKAKGAKCAKKGGKGKSKKPRAGHERGGRR